MSVLPERVNAPEVIVEVKFQPRSDLWLEERNGTFYFAIHDLVNLRSKYFDKVRPGVKTGKPKKHPSE